MTKTLSAVVVVLETGGGRVVVYRLVLSHAYAGVSGLWHLPNLAEKVLNGEVGKCVKCLQYMVAPIVRLSVPTTLFLIPTDMLR